MTLPRFPKPVPGPITSPFGPRVQKPSPHNGQDYGWSYTNPDYTRRILAPLTGIVGVGHNDLIGNFVTMTIGDGYWIRLCHFESVVVRNGQAVSRGQHLGRMGDTGSQAAGVHLHVDLYTPAGIRIDPALVFTTTFVGLVAPASSGATPIPEPTIEEQIMARDTLYVKGSTNPAVMALDTRTGLRRNVSAQEFAVVNSAGKPNYGSTPDGAIIVIPQATLDSLAYQK